MPGTQRFILMPLNGLIAESGMARATLESAQTIDSNPVIDGETLHVIASSHENGAKLVEATHAAAAAINASATPVKMVPEVNYPKPRIEPMLHELVPFESVAMAAGATTTIRCVDAVTGQPAPGAKVVAFDDFINRRGADGVTDGAGTCRVRLAGASIERLYIYGPSGYWGGFRRDLPAGGMINVPLAPVDITVPDIVRSLYGNSRFDLAAGVQIGIIDSGCGPHRDLNIVHRATFVTGDPNQDPRDFDVHGTHVAGLAGARGGVGALRGVAAGVAIKSYRVFPSSGGGASNFDIMNAIEAAARDGCDIINLSLGGGPHEDAVANAVGVATTYGALVIAAAGNGGRRAVAYPAAYPDVVAVSAIGREDLLPPGSADDANIERPPASVLDPREFIAAFSNIGPQVAVTGPGVGTLSTLPGDRYGPLSGTSMAAPVVAGAAACLLSRNPGVLSMPRNATRSAMIRALLIDSCTKRGFGAIFEGAGLPDPTRI